ncbi:hypothetical protein O6B72_01610 [Campylobacter ureolyticus]|uniref:hypothetical protein n=1 Tax=Campylobacter ureolyticus TaxID=827 RepID=UPI0022B4966B|nr:hypothetical protein [Campylobacter ureolyticus]MCZ6155519.1 hypothetical protein [Campylobacter ureolyticus]
MKNKKKILKNCKNLKELHSTMDDMISNDEISNEDKKELLNYYLELGGVNRDILSEYVKLDLNLFINALCGDGDRWSSNASLDNSIEEDLDYKILTEKEIRNLNRLWFLMFGKGHPDEI